MLLDDGGDGGTEARSACAEGQRAAGASAASALGSTQSYCFTPKLTSRDAEQCRAADAGERRRVRWAARAMLWQASSLKAVRCCGRMLHNDGIGDPDDGQSVVVRRREVDGRMVASFQGLMTCGSVWACPRCSAVIAHTRAAEIGAADSGSRWHEPPASVRVAGEPACHEELDVAVIELEQTGDGLNTVSGIVWRDPLPTDKASVFGYPPVPTLLDVYMLTHGGEVVNPHVMTRQSGEVVNPAVESQQHRRFFLYSSTSRPGNSGGPIVAQDGRVIGIVAHSTFDRAKVDEPEYYRGIPGGEVIRALNELDLGHLAKLEDWELQ